MNDREVQKYLINYERLNPVHNDLEAGLNFIFTISDDESHFHYHFASRKPFSNVNHFIDLCMKETMRLIKYKRLDTLYREYSHEEKWIDLNEE
ncbi:MAG: hypothetical protein HQ509_05720 [Candidatus Marinimicrobia bacterium]|nr:hypothetical protein [Candidatus Neomarinimicrobiota bacterium]